MNAGVWLLIKIIFQFQVRTSYVPGEILWGYRFEHKCVSYDNGCSQMMSPAQMFNLIRDLNPDMYFWLLWNSVELWFIICDCPQAMNKYAVSYTAINSFIPDRTPR